MAVEIQCYTNSAIEPLAPLLEALGVTHNFDYPLFENLNLALYPSESIAIIGPSGSGKSTFLNIISSLLKPQYGSVVYNHQNIYDLSYEEILKVRKNDFGIIFQSHYLFHGFSAQENLEVAELISGQKLDDSILTSFKIGHILRQNVGELSGGEQQRLSIARVLAKKPKILFADEPTGNLDMATALDVMESLFDYIKGANDRGLFLVTHEEVLAYKCDKVYKIENNSVKELK